MCGMTQWGEPFISGSGEIGESLGPGQSAGRETLINLPTFRAALLPRPEPVENQNRCALG